ncbi:DUF4224 domain-containing protein [Methyloversatilis sp.]|uniref:DUF4224 domain-containing protein n=1 Tax=Methyloversatilis sp. TaxID=2569862 RepID=UPI0027352BD2|nr:DUF4224 domain-containing protein [Methyloversatilis sp.]MDP3579104.1 DUF4224 domain-containing protein [Methyloversatilis sp.]
MDMFLTDAEISRICEPLVQAAAQVRYLRELGLTVTTKPNGRPLVVRSHAEAVLSGRPIDQLPAFDVERKSPGPNRERFLASIARDRAA